MTGAPRYVHVSFVFAAASSSVAPSLSRRFARILQGVLECLAVRAARDHAMAPLALLVWKRMGHAITRFAAIAARYHAGTLRAPPKPAARRASAGPPPPRDPLPRQAGWLPRRVQGCSVYGEYLRRLLEEPELAAMIEAAPQLRRLLRPLWRMLRTDRVPPVLRPPPPAPTPPPRRIRLRPQNPPRAQSAPPATRQVTRTTSRRPRPLNRT